MSQLFGDTYRPDLQDTKEDIDVSEGIFNDLCACAHNREDHNPSCVIAPCACILFEE